MRRNTLAASVVLILLAVMAMAPASALAAVVRQGDTVDVAEDVAEDLYVFGSSIEVTGRIDGDLIAFGNVVTVDGEVTGDIVAAASTVRLNGDVGGSVRAAAGTIDVSGDVAEDVLAAGGEVRLAAGSAVGRDALIAGGTAAVRSDVARHLMLGAGNAEIAGNIGGDVRAEVESLTLSEGARVSGDLTYSAQRASGVEQSVVGGEIDRRTPTRPEQRRPTATEVVFTAVVGWVRGYVGAVLLGLLFVLVVPVFAADSSQYVFGRWLPSLGVGLGVMFVLPGVAFVVFLVGLFVGGWWIAPMLLAVWWIALAVGAVVAAIAVGRAILGRLTNPTAQLLLGLLLGLLVLRLIGAVPLLGWLVGFVAMVMGTGALVLAVFDRRAAADAVGAAAPLPAEPPGI